MYTQLEVLSLAAESLRRMSDRAILDIASVEWVSALLALSRADRETEKALLQCLREKNAHGIAALCRDADIPEDFARAWQGIASLYGPAKDALPQLAQWSLDEGMRAACGTLSALCGALQKDAGVDVNLDFSILSDLKYYNGLVFKGYVPGVHTGILSGGRYDNLVKKMGKQAGAIGFAVYLDLLDGLPGKDRPLDADVLLLYGENDLPRDVMRKARALRESGLRVRVQKENDGGRYGRIERMEGGA